EVREHPDIVERDDRQKRLAHLDHLPHLDRALRDDAVDWRTHLGVLELEVGEGEVRLRLTQSRLRLRRRRVLDRHLVELALGARRDASRARAPSTADSLARTATTAPSRVARAWSIAARVSSRASGSSERAAFRFASAIDTAARACATRAW